ncbi:MAG: CinA family protein [Acidimicrobiia bacterium]
MSIVDELSPMAAKPDQVEIFGQLIHAAERSGHSLGTAESVTGGLLGYRLTSVAGSGEVFRGGLVAHQRDLKFRLLGVPEGPVVSAPAARAMAIGARRLLGCDLAVALTGVAGPEEQDGQPVGTVFIAIAADNSSQAREYHYAGEPVEVRWQAAVSAAQNLASVVGSSGRIE